MADSQSVPNQPPNTINPVFDAQGGANRTPGCPLAASDTAGECITAKADDGPAAFVIGLAVKPAIDTDRVLTQFAGPLTLTTAEWDTILHNVSPAGLTPGAAYYLSETTAGKLSENIPGSGYRNQVGVALSTTTMLVQVSGAVLV